MENGIHINPHELDHVKKDARIEIASKVGKLLVRNRREEDAEAALEMARLLVDDVSVSVREALSRELQSCTFLPKEIVETLANDIEQISVPFLVSSQAIDDVTLEKLIRCKDETVQKAIARRKGLGENVCYAICEVGVVPAVEELMKNETADITPRSFEMTVKRFPEEVGLMEALASHRDLPPEIAETIIFRVSSQYSRYLMEKFSLASDYAIYLTSLAKRKVFNQTMEISPRKEIQNFISQLEENKGLTSDMMLGYLQNKHVRLFTSALSVYLKQPYDTVLQLVKSQDERKMAHALEKCGFSNAVCGVLLIAYDRLFIHES